MMGCTPSSLTTKIDPVVGPTQSPKKPCGDKKLRDQQQASLPSVQCVSGPTDDPQRHVTAMVALPRAMAGGTRSNEPPSTSSSSSVAGKSHRTASACSNQTPLMNFFNRTGTYDSLPEFRFGNTPGGEGGLRPIKDSPTPWLPTSGTTLSTFANSTLRTAHNLTYLSPHPTARATPPATGNGQQPATVRAPESIVRDWLLQTGAIQAPRLEEEPLAATLGDEASRRRVQDWMMDVVIVDASAEGVKVVASVEV